MKRALALLWIVLSACTSTLVDYETRVHVVRPGETLYTIAWRHGLDQRSLAAWNGLADPNLIFVGQRLRLRPPAGSAARPVPRPAASGASPRPAASGASPRSLPAPPALPAPAWRWPTRGPLVSEFGTAGEVASGIGIGGRVGQDINAASSGRVVYAGSGLIGYGQLVIVEHNDTYLTAYGHNSRLLVEQGQTVQQGQKIAEMGLGPGQMPRLHFEIRRNGVPVDPLQQLPR
jgi:lipoprotein NlpD